MPKKAKVADEITNSLAASPWAKVKQPAKAAKQKASSAKQKAEPTATTKPQASPARTLAEDASTFNQAKFAQYVRALSKTQSQAKQEVAYIRFTPQEKKLLTDFTNLDLYPAGLTGDSVSVSKLLRYFSWYLLNNCYSSDKNGHRLDLERELLSI